MRQFLHYYLRSMRLYYCFVTGTATLAGCVAARGVKSVHLPFWDWRDAVVLIIGFLAWGVNQVVSDWFDRKEDALNAPHRPMVTGELAPRPALILSGSLMALFAVMAYLVSPVSLLILIVGGLLNLLYSLLKWVPVLDTLIYATAITCCTFFGLSAHCDLMGNGGHWILPVLCFWSTFLLYSMMFSPGSHSLPERLLLFGFLLMMVYLTCQLFRRLWKKECHAATRLNCQLCVTWLWMIPSAFSPYWLIGMFASVLLIEILYRWYPDEKE